MQLPRSTAALRVVRPEARRPLYRSKAPQLSGAALIYSDDTHQ
jgi:hypothetical protein